jgi:peptide/nickel transport system substrate-binding protein
MTVLTRTLHAVALCLGLAAMPSVADPAHRIAMHGVPALPPDFPHLPHANPEAPKGGTFTFGIVGGFDSLNPFILRGRVPGEVRAHTFESLMGRNWDEPFTLYGLLAESVEISDDRQTVSFTLRPEARFSDGAPVTVEDVLWSMETLAAVGRPNFATVWRKVAAAEQTGPRSLRFRLTGGDREAAMILGLVPVLRKARFAERDLAEPTLEPLVGTGPYVITDLEAGRFLELTRNRDYWGRDLPFNAGQHNFDTIRVEFFRDGNALFDALRAGQVSLFRETDAARWQTAYGFDAVRQGLIERVEIPHGRPTGMNGFVFNIRNPLFADIRVREALTLAFDFEWINRTLFEGAFARIESYFDNSPLAHDGAAAGREAAILAPFADRLPQGALAATVAQPVSDGSGRNRRNLRDAAMLLEEAGWRLDGGALRDGEGRRFAFEILLGSSANERIAGIFRDALTTLGIDATVRTVDSAQYQARIAEYDFDMIVNRWGLSLSPGNEQRFYWGSESAATPGTRNYMGVEEPAIDAAIDAMLAARELDDFEAAVRALDRVLTAGRYVIPFWYAPTSRIAHDARLAFPDYTPLYGDWIGWAPEVWWWEGE